MTCCARCGFDPHALIAARWEFTVPLEIQSGNDHVVNAPRGKGRARWARSGAYKQRRVQWQTAVRVQGRYVTQAASGGSLANRRRVTVTRVYSGRQRELDRDNLYAGAKVAVDALKHCGVIVDDRREWCELHVVQERGAERGTRFLIEELG